MNKSVLIQRRLPEIKKLLSPCRLCPRNCNIDRTSGQIGFCGLTDQIKIASWAQHRGEEPPISGVNGSGTIFVSGCTLRCLFCQNFPFSQMHNGQIMTADELGKIYSRLAKTGIHNLNFVTPTHVVPMLLEAWLCSDEKAQSLPIVYNCSGYESMELLRLLDGIIDIYLPDIKYSDNKIAIELSKAPNYVAINRQALVEMSRQVGELQVNPETGFATKGMIVRHLVLPGQLAGSKESLYWLRETLGLSVRLSIMSQYFPAYKAFEHPVICKTINLYDYAEILELVNVLGFENVWAQDPTEHGGA